MAHEEVVGKAGIEYADVSWNAYTGCRNIEEKKCTVHRCWARRTVLRLAGRHGYDANDPFQPTLHDMDMQTKPYSWKNGKRIATSFMGDVSYLDEVWDVKSFFTIMADNPQHRFYVLTKAPEAPIFSSQDWMDNVPLNLWMGVSINHQDEMWKLEELLKIKAKCHFVSFEPVLSSLDLDEVKLFDWAIVGAQTRPDVIKCAEIYSLVRQLNDYNIPIFFKPNLGVMRQTLTQPDLFPDIGEYMIWYTTWKV